MSATSVHGGAIWRTLTIEAGLECEVVNLQ